MLEKIKYSGEDLYPYERTAVEYQPKKGKPIHTKGKTIKIDGKEKLSYKMVDGREKICFKSIKSDNGVAQLEDNIVEVDTTEYTPVENSSTTAGAWINGEFVRYYPPRHVEHPTLADAGIKVGDFYTTDVPIPEKYALSIKEAVAYFGIGERKLRKLVDANEFADWFFMNGTKILIKRKQFEKYLDEASYI